MSPIDHPSPPTAAPTASPAHPRRRGRSAPTSCLTAAALALASCGGPPDVPRDTEPLLQTSALRYTLERDELGFRATIPYAFRNDTGGPVHLPNCGGDVRPLLQVQRGDAWFDAWEPFRETCQDPPVTIAAGDVFTDTLRLFGAPAGSNLVPAFAFEEVEGVYRLLWNQAVTRHDGGAPDPKALLPIEQRTSNRFVLER